jgi:alpha-ribazole phosphatase/probable phosphoglycerate mutase
MSEITTIDLMRHGEPVGGRRYRGQIDDPLSERGWREMRQAVSQQSPWQAIISSPLKRCSEFALELSSRLKIGLSYDERLKEVGFGSWEGLSGDQLRARDSTVLSRFYHDPLTNRPLGAEPLDSFNHRVNQAFADAATGHRGKHILLVTHAGVIRSILTQVLKAPSTSLYRLSIATASLSRIQIDNERPPTIFFVSKTSL